MISTKTRVFLLTMALCLAVGSVLLGSPRGILVEAVRSGLQLEIDKGCGATYFHDETLDVTVTSEMDGFLSIYDFMPDGRVQRIFPNQYSPYNQIERGVEYKIPGTLLPFVFRVGPPDGEEVLFAVVTSAPYDVLPEGYMTLADVFPQITRGDEETATAISNSLGLVPENIKAAAALCFFTIAGEPGQPVPEPDPKPEPEPKPEPKPEPEAETKGEVYALLVAVSDYANDDFDLEYPISQNIISAVRTTLGDWIDHTRYLSDRYATRSAILEAMDSFLGQAGPNDTVYFHFAGHGYFVADDDGDEGPGDDYDEVIIPYDGRFIRDDEIGEAIEKLEAKHAVLVFESCHSGTAERGLGVFTPYEDPAVRSRSASSYSGGMMGDDLGQATTRSTDAPTVLALQACSADQSAWFSNTSDGISYFARYLLRAFSEFGEDADANNDGWVSFQEAFELAAPAVEQTVAQAGEEQTPRLYDGIDEEVNVVPVE